MQPSKSTVRAVFLDKDGTLVEDVPYNADPAYIRFTPGAPEALQLLSSRYKLAIVSNQPGIARGLFTQRDLDSYTEALRQELVRLGARFEGFYYCPHNGDGGSYGTGPLCECRKPRPGLLLRAMQDLGLQGKQCWLVGDILNDIEAGRRAGCRTLFLDNGHETEWVAGELRTPHFVASDLLEAARIIIDADRTTSLIAGLPTPRPRKS